MASRIVFKCCRLKSVKNVAYLSLIVKTTTSPRTALNKVFILTLLAIVISRFVFQTPAKTNSDLLFLLQISSERIPKQITLCVQ